MVVRRLAIGAALSGATTAAAATRIVIEAIVQCINGRVSLTDERG
jgi:hypothetical protein